MGWMVLNFNMITPNSEVHMNLRLHFRLSPILDIKNLIHHVAGCQEDTASNVNAFKNCKTAFSAMHVQL